MRTLAYTIGTALGSGYAPLAPGTAGSILALLLYYFIPFSTAYWVLLTILLFFAGVWASNLIEKEKGDDPGLIVIDEVVGQWITLWFIPLSINTAVAAFILFRLMDIWKPYPVNRSQNLGNGWGVMLDDVLAAVYANLLLQIIFNTGWIL